MDQYELSQMTPGQRAAAMQAQRMQEMMAAGMDPMDAHMMAGNIARSGYQDLESRLKAYQSLGFGKNKNDSYSRWYLN